MLHKRLADKIKSGMAWSVISEEGERIPTNNDAKDGESNHDDLSPLSVVSSEESETPPPVVDTPWSMEKALDNSGRKFQPEFLLKRPEKEEPAAQEPPVKRPTAAFRTALEKNSVPKELVQSCELLADAVISMSLSVLSAEKTSDIPPQKEPSSPDRRSIEFKSFASKELKGAG